MNYVMKMTNGQVFRIQNDSDTLFYPYCLCMKQLSEADMQVLFKKEIYDRTKCLGQEIVKYKPQRIYNLVEEQNYHSKNNINIFCRDSDILNTKEIVSILENNKNIKKIIIKEGEINENIVDLLSNLVVKFPSLASISFKDVMITTNILKLLCPIMSKVKVQKLTIKKCYIASQLDFEEIGKIILQTKAQHVVLKQVGMNDYGLIYISQAISQAEALKDLDISYNNITRMGLKCIEDVLKDNDHLQNLHLKQARSSQVFYDFIRGMKSIIKNIEFDVY